MLRLLPQVFLFLWAATSTVVAQDWPQWRGPHRNGYVDDSLSLSDEIHFQSEWTVNVGTGFSSIAVVDGHVVTIGNQDDIDTVVCLNSDDESLIWKHSYPQPLDPNLFEGGPTATPTIDDGNVYTISRRGNVFCLRLKTGEVVWQRNLVEDLSLNIPSWGFSGSPLIFGDQVIVNAGAHGVSLNKESGDIVWQSGNDEDAGYSSLIVVHHGTTPLVLLLSAKSLHAVHPKTGELAWSFPWITRYGINAADPIPWHDNQIIVSSGYGKGTALVKYTAESAEQIWRTRDLKNQMSPGVVLDGLLYAVDGDNGPDTRLVCFNPENQEVLWSEDGFGSASLISLGDNLVILSGTGELAVASTSEKGLDVRHSESILDGKCWTPPAYAEGAIFARNADGDLTKVKIMQ